MTRKVCIIALIILAAALPALAGESKYVSGDTYVLKQGETVDGDLFVFSRSITIEGTVTGEAFLMGSDVSITGEVLGDAFVIGDNVKLSGRFATDSRVLGNTVDLVGAFDGEISAAGRKIYIDADVRGAVNVGGETIDASGTFSDTVNLHGMSVTLLPNARFDKDVTVSAEEFRKADSVVIAGDFNHVIGEELTREKKEEGIAGWWTVLAFWFVTLCGIVIVGLIVNWLFPDLTEKTTKTMAAEPIASLGWGLLTLILLPIVLGILLITLVGIPIGLLLLVAVFVALYLGKMFVAVVTGGGLISFFLKEEAPFWVRLIIGAVVVYLVLAIPVAGFFIAIIVYCLGLGAIINQFLTSRKKPAPAKAKASPRTPRTKKQ